MEDTALPPDSMLEAVLEDSVDLDLINELLLEEVWMGSAECSGFMRQGTFTSSAPFESSYLFSPLSEIENRFSNPNPEGYANHGGSQRRSSHRDSRQVDEETKNKIGTHLNPCTRDFAQYPGPTGEPGSRDGPSNWSTEARAHVGSTSLKDRLSRILNYIKDSYRDCDVLVQIWVPMNNGDRQILTTYGQPFSLSPNCQRLMNYRNVSMAYQFSAEENSEETLGLPGRVFLGKVPEWSPDVRYFTNSEYARVNYAQRYDVRGTLGIPIFQHGGCICLGVMEVLMTTERINYHSDLEQICNALQAVNLNSSDVLNVPRVKMKNDSYLAALPEISSVIRAVCQAHGLPLAQTWIPCIQQGKNGCRHSDVNYKDCVSTLDVACYVHDPFLSGFHEACSEHHLLRGQGVVGKAFMTNQPCFSSDIAAFSKTEYPLSHHARIFGLRAAVAIRLRSVHTEKADYVLEFFLPTNCLKSEEQKVMLNSLSVTIQQVCQSLRVVTTKELEDEIDLQDSSNCLYQKHLDIDNGSQGRSKTVMAPSMDIPGSETSYITDNMEIPEENTILCAYASLDFDKQAPQGFSVTKWGGSVPEATHLSEGMTPCYQESAKHVKESGAFLNGHPCFSKRDKMTERKHSKTEKTFSLQLLQQYFAGSLKDAAKSLGVCPTTLKRICRQHGITRWPSRKIKKVGHSLRKLQVVIDSVQGVDGTLQLSSLYASFPDSCGSDVNNQKGYTEGLDGDPELSNVQHGLRTTHTSASNSPSSSCSQASNSSHSSEALECQRAANIPIKEETSFEENQNDIPMRVPSEPNLHLSSLELPSTLVRSQSLRSIGENSGPCGQSSPCQNRHIGGQLRVKAMYGEEKVRFSLQPSWGIQELKQEIAKRFHIGNINLMDLKYLDDDSEWVLLTCDADLEECTDVYRTSSVHIIKILVHHSAQQSDVSFGSGTITS